MNSDESLFKSRAITARAGFLASTKLTNCCDARRNPCSTFRDITKGKVAEVKRCPVSACGDTVEVTIMLRGQHTGVTRHGSEGKRQDGGHAW